MQFVSIYRFEPTANKGGSSETTPTETRAKMRLSLKTLILSTKTRAAYLSVGFIRVELCILIDYMEILRTETFIDVNILPKIMISPKKKLIFLLSFQQGHVKHNQYSSKTLRIRCQRIVMHRWNQMHRHHQLSNQR